MDDNLEQQLLGTWMHSHEEDKEGNQVYRRGEYDFPPARGRTGFELNKGGECVYLGIAARDGTEKRNCTWQIDTNNMEFTIRFADGRSDTMTIVSIADDKLVVRKPRK